jgi:hypothetical protein
VIKTTSGTEVVSEFIFLTTHPTAALAQNANKPIAMVMIPARLNQEGDRG